MFCQKRPKQRDLFDVNHPLILGGGSQKDVEEDGEGFNDEFRPFKDDPLYEEDTTTPLPEFPVVYKQRDLEKQGFDLMVRMPLKKKMMMERHWKMCNIRIFENMLYIYDKKEEERPFYELPIQVSVGVDCAHLSTFVSISYGFDAFAECRQVSNGLSVTCRCRRIVTKRP